MDKSHQGSRLTPIVDDVIQALRVLGLTEWEARVYHAVVALGETTAANAAEVANVPRTRSYALLDNLEVKGWVVSQNVRPKRYRAVAPGQTLEKGRQRIEGRIRAAQEKLEALHSQEGARWAGSVWLLSGEDAIQRRLAAMVDSARNDIIWSRATTLPGDDKILAALGKAFKRGARVRMLVRQPNLVPKDAAFRRYAEIRFTEVPLWVMFVDGNQAFSAFAIPENGEVTYRGLWNPNRDLVEIFVTVLEAAWTQAGGA